MIQDKILMDCNEEFHSISEVFDNKSFLSIIGIKIDESIFSIKTYPSASISTVRSMMINNYIIVPNIERWSNVLSNHELNSLIEFRRSIDEESSVAILRISSLGVPGGPSILSTYMSGAIRHDGMRLVLTLDSYAYVYDNDSNHYDASILVYNK